jgi:hypothetical protein
MRLTLIDRHIKTLESYLASQLGSRFYQEDFLKGIAHQRDLIVQRLGLAAKGLYVISGLVLATEAASGSISISGLSIPINEAIRMPLAFILALSIFATLLATLNQIIIDRYISMIGMKANLYSFQIVIANYTSQNLWSDPLTPKYFGLKSGRGHKFAFGIWSWAAIMIMIITMFIPCTAVMSTSIRTLATPNHYFADVIAISNLFILLVSVGLFVLMNFVKFQFDPADFDEVDGKPTKEFLTKLESETARSA